jgi:hypothetical protein
MFAKGPLFGRLIRAFNHSLYETRAIEGALKEAFTEDASLFGEATSTIGMPKIKVAVTAAAVSSCFVLSNYNRFPETSRACFMKRDRIDLLTMHSALPFRTPRKSLRRTPSMGSVSRNNTMFHSDLIICA